jgi:hypothetical protein
MINEKVAVLHDQSTNTRGEPRVPTPPLYNGEGDTEVYERWLSTLLRWLRINKICGAEYDEERIVYAPMYLEGDVLSWFNDNIDNFHCQQEYWTFKEVIMGLYDHFVFRAATCDASDKFWSMAFQEGDDIMSFYYKMVRYATQMVQAPDRYTFKSQLMMNMPLAMFNFVISKGCSAEHSLTETILHYAEQAEENNRQSKQWTDRRYTGTNARLGRTIKPLTVPIPRPCPRMQPTMNECRYKPDDQNDHPARTSNHNVGSSL